MGFFNQDSLLRKELFQPDSFLIHPLDNWVSPEFVCPSTVGSAASLRIAYDTLKLSSPL